MKILIRLLLCLGLCWFAIAKAVTPAKSPAKTNKSATKSSAGSSAKKAGGKKADAKTLLHDARRALAAMVKEARADKGLDPKTAKNKPFWKSTQALAKSLKTAESGLTAKSNDFFKGIEDARQAEAQMKVDWQLTDSKNPKVIASGKRLGHALAALRTNYSKEAARKKKGGDLTADEKAQFEKIKARQKELLGKIGKLKAKAQKDKALAKGLNDIEKQANEILKKPATLDAYLAALYLLDLQTGLIRGYEYYVDKPWRDDYIYFVDYAKWYDTWYVDWSDPVAYDWVYVDTPVDVYVDVDVVDDSLTDADINSEDQYAENEPFDMSDAEEDEVAAEEDDDADADGDDDSMEDASDDDGTGMEEDDGGDDEGDISDDDGADDDGGDDGGGDDSGDDGGDEG